MSRTNYLRAVLCEWWWEDPFYLHPLTGEPIPFFPVNIGTDPRTTEYPRDSYDAFTRIAGLLGVEAELPDKEFPAKVTVTEINAARASWKEFCSYQRGHVGTFLPGPNEFTFTREGPRQWTDENYYGEGIQFNTWYYDSFALKTDSWSGDLIVSAISVNTQYAPNWSYSRRDMYEVSSWKEYPNVPIVRIGSTPAAYSLAFYLPAIARGRYSGYWSERFSVRGVVQVGGRTPLFDPPFDYGHYSQAGGFVEKVEFVERRPPTTTDITFSNPKGSWDEPPKQWGAFLFNFGFLHEINEAEDYITIRQVFPFDFDFSGLDFETMDYRDRRYFALTIQTPLAGTAQFNWAKIYRTFQFSGIQRQGNFWRFLSPKFMFKEGGNAWPSFPTTNTVWQELKLLYGGIAEMGVLLGGHAIYAPATSNPLVDQSPFWSDELLARSATLVPRTVEYKDTAVSGFPPYSSISYEDLVSVSTRSVAYAGEDDVPLVLPGAKTGILYFLGAQLLEGKQLPVVGRRPIAKRFHPALNLIVDGGLLDPLTAEQAVVSDAEPPRTETINPPLLDRLSPLDLAMVLCKPTVCQDSVIGTLDGRMHFVNGLTALLEGRFDKSCAALTFMRVDLNGRLIKKLRGAQDCYVEDPHPGYRPLQRMRLADLAGCTVFGAGSRRIIANSILNGLSVVGAGDGEGTFSAGMNTPMSFDYPYLLRLNLVYDDHPEYGELDQVFTPGLYARSDLGDQYGYDDIKVYSIGRPNSPINVGGSTADYLLWSADRDVELAVRPRFFVSEPFFSLPSTFANSIYIAPYGNYPVLIDDTTKYRARPDLSGWDLIDSPQAFSRSRTCTVPVSHASAKALHFGYKSKEQYVAEIAYGVLHLNILGGIYWQGKPDVSRGPVSVSFSMQIELQIGNTFKSYSFSSSLTAYDVNGKTLVQAEGELLVEIPTSTLPETFQTSWFVTDSVQNASKRDSSIGSVRVAYQASCSAPPPIAAPVAPPTYVGQEVTYSSQVLFSVPQDTDTGAYLFSSWFAAKGTTILASKTFSGLNGDSGPYTDRDYHHIGDAARVELSIHTYGLHPNDAEDKYIVSGDLGTITSLERGFLGNQSLNDNFVTMRHNFFGIRSPSAATKYGNFKGLPLYGENVPWPVRADQTNGNIVLLSEGRQQIYVALDEEVVVFNVNRAVGTVSFDGGKWYYTPIKPGWDFLCMIDPVNRIPISVRVYVFGKTFAGTTAQADTVFTFVTHYARSQRLDSAQPFNLKWCATAGLPGLTITYDYTRSRVNFPDGHLNYYSFSATTKQIPKTTPSADTTTYLTDRKVRVKFDNGFPTTEPLCYFYFSADAADVKYTGVSPASETTQFYHILSGSERLFKREGDVMVCDLSASLFGLPLGKTINIMVVDPDFSHKQLFAFGTLLPPLAEPTSSNTAEDGAISESNVGPNGEVTLV